MSDKTEVTGEMVAAAVRVAERNQELHAPRPWTVEWWRSILRAALAAPPTPPAREAQPVVKPGPVIYVDDAAARIQALEAERDRLRKAIEKRQKVDDAYTKLALTECDFVTRERRLEAIEDAEYAAKHAARAALAQSKEQP